MSGSAMKPLRVFSAAAFVLLVVFAGRVPARRGTLPSQNKLDGDPVRRAKNLPRAGDAQFEHMRKELDAGDYPQALHILQEYRDEVRSTEQALKASGVDAERHPGGFKQLQIHVRKSVRELGQILLSLPEEQREGFDAVRKDLVNMEKELIEMLFPRAPGKNAEKAKPKG